MQASQSLLQTVFKDPNQRLASGVRRSIPFLNVVCLSHFLLLPPSLSSWGSNSDRIQFLDEIWLRIVLVPFICIVTDALIVVIFSFYSEISSRSSAEKKYGFRCYCLWFQAFGQYVSLERLVAAYINISLWNPIPLLLLMSSLNIVAFHINISLFICRSFPNLNRILYTILQLPSSSSPFPCIPAAFIPLLHYLTPHQRKANPSNYPPTKAKSS